MKVKDHPTMSRCDRVPGIIRINDPKAYNASMTARQKAVEREQRIVDLETKLDKVLEYLNGDNNKI